VGQSTNGSPASYWPFPFVSLYGSSSEKRWGPSNVPVVSQLAGFAVATAASGGVMSATAAPTWNVAAIAGVAAARATRVAGTIRGMRMRFLRRGSLRRARGACQ
jgi:hypothetical protein